MTKPARLLAVVEDTFAISDRGLVIAPFVDLGGGPPRVVTVELHRPDGTVVSSEARAEVPFFDPPRPQPEARHVLRFASLTKLDVPIGTEIWMQEDG